MLRKTSKAMDYPAGGSKFLTGGGELWAVLIGCFDKRAVSKPEPPGRPVEID